ncbi:hypothetical protein [Erwinia persicina]|uniref:hypothetical protein n=1 Tax=Erwinia persicina TaxID=55211 RepID=UPI001786AC52|nr:hypothetical protein [Erwinia persicina]MBD8163715.1 hypothetical protein [Erwinia persicina]
MSNANFDDLKDEGLSIIFNFSPAIFDTNNASGGYVYRVIEIYRIFKMRGFIESLSLITEREFIKIFPEVNELMAIISTGKLICKREREKRDIRLSELEAVKKRFEDASIGTAHRPAGYNDRRDWMADLEAKINTSESSLKDAEKALIVSRGLLALIRPVVEHMLNVAKVKLPVGILAELPEDNLPSYVYCDGGVFSNGIKAACVAWTEMDALEKAIKNIVDSCHPSGDKHKMNSLWHKFRMQHYYFYYSQHGENARMFFSAKEYVDKMTEIDIARERKQKTLSTSF